MIADQELKFIGRQDHINTSLKLINSSESRPTVAYVVGEGGIGKTTFIRRLHSLLGQFAPHITSTLIIDLADPTLRSLLVLLSHIGEQIDANAFDSFIQDLKEFEKKRSKEQGLPSDSVQESYQLLTERFVATFNALSVETRIVIFLDSAEYVKSHDFWADFFSVVVEMTDTCLFLTGRPAGIDAAKGKAQAYKHAKLKQEDISLKELDLADAAKFLQLSIPALDEELQWKLHYLTDGKPLLLELVWYRLLRGLNLPELTRETQSSLKEQVSKELRTRFEASLVDFLLPLENSVDEALVIMALLDQRFDAEIAAVATGMSADQIGQLLQDLKNVPYVKLLGGYYVLHEDVATLVRDHVWERLDPFRERRIELLNAVLAYYENKILDLRNVLDQHQRDLNEALTEQKTDYFRDRHQQKFQEQVSKYEHERIAYECNEIVPAKLKEAVAHFVSAFDYLHDFHYKEDLLTMLEDKKVVRRLNPGDYFEVSLRRARLLREKVPTEAIEELESWENLKLSPSQTVIWYSLRGDIARQRGKMREALRYQDNAIAEAMASEPSKIAMSFQNKARTLFAMGDFQKAAELYEKAILQMPTTTPKEAEDRADVMGNLAFLLGRMGDWVDGLAWAEAALKIKKQYAKSAGVAQMLIILGSIYWTKGEYKVAREKYEIAMQGLEDSVEDRLVKGRAFFSLGIADWFAKDFNSAEENFRQAIELFNVSHNKRELPLAVHNLGHIKFEQGDLVEAERLFIQGEELSRDYQDYFALADSLVGLAELRKRQGHVDEIKDLEHKISALNNEGYRFPLFEGRMQRIQGEVALASGNQAEAGSRFARGIASVAQHGGYGKYSLGEEISRLSHIMDDLPEDTVLEWCQLLEDEATKARLTDRRQEIDAFVKVRRAILGRWS